MVYERVDSWEWAVMDDDIGLIVIMMIAFGAIGITLIMFSIIFLIIGMVI